jgi:dipeptidyl aminopeptidase/acylaminoacyl peptidase
VFNSRETFMKTIASVFAACICWLPFSGMVIAATETEKKFARAADIPVSVFFKRAEYGRMSLSPDGKKLAAVAPINGRGNLVVIALDKRTAIPITTFDDVDVSDFVWLTNDRLYLTVANLEDASGSISLRGAYAVDADGKNTRNLMRSRDSGPRTARFSLLSRTYDGSGDVIAVMTGRSRSSTDVFRFNTATGVAKLLTFDNPGNVSRWVVDRNLSVRIALRTEPRKDADSPRQLSMWHRENDDKPWERIWIGERESESIVPLAFDYDNKTLYVSSNLGRDLRAIYKYDIANKKLGEEIFSHSLIDVSDGLIFSSHKKALIGIRYEAEKSSVKWFDESAAALQREIDKALPVTINRIYDADENARNVLINAYSDTDAGTYYLFDTEKRSLEAVAKQRPWLPPALMGERRFVQYTSRDGKKIPAWLTLPRESSGKNLPLVVHIHGGPRVRGYYGAQWGRNADAQFFASRGYAVLEPEPRGSTGFGRNHSSAGNKQWGLAMQDDITDGALHLVKEGIVDKDRMCLYGGSYGGYATLQGLVKDPDLWKCGHATVAVTDLELLQSITYSDTARLSDYFETDFKRLVGDKDADREQFTKTSPAKNADKIKAPVMITMGVEDQRVPLAHGEAMRSALERAGKKFEYKAYQGEAHGFNKMENLIDLYTRTERFFAEHLKKTP